MGLVKPRRKSKRTDAAGHRVIDPVYSLTISAAAGLVLFHGAWQKWQQKVACIAWAFSAGAIFIAEVWE
jgi:hypothetical protein